MQIFSIFTHNLRDSPQRERRGSVRGGGGSDCVWIHWKLNSTRGVRSHKYWYILMDSLHTHTHTQSVTHAPETATPTQSDWDLGCRKGRARIGFFYSGFSILDPGRFFFIVVRQLGQQSSLRASQTFAQFTCSLASVTVSFIYVIYRIFRLPLPLAVLLLLLLLGFKSL